MIKTPGHSSGVVLVRQSSPGHGESGAALAIAILMLALLSAVALGVLAVVTTDVEIAGSDLKRTQACYASAAAIEIMTNDFSELFTRTSRPTQGQLDDISDNLPTALTAPTDPTDISYTFPDHKLEVNQAALDAMGPNAKVDIPYGPFVGMYASLKPYTLTTTARSTIAECKLTRDMNNYLIPLFQFGMFSSNDIELNPGQDFFFNGRVHANGNIYATGKMKFLDKVTTGNEFIYDVMRNGNKFRDSATDSDIDVSMTMKIGGIKVPIKMGSMITGPRIAAATATPVGQRGYYPKEADGTTETTKLGTINPTWDTTSVMAASSGVANRLGTQLLTRTTGAALLKLPLQLDNHSTRELIKRRMPHDSPDPSNPSPLSESRYHTKSQIRILIDDESPADTDESGIPSGGVVLSTFDPMLLPNKALSTSPTADGGGRALWRIKDNNTSVDTSYDETTTSFVRQFNNGGTLAQAETVRGVKAVATPTPLTISGATKANPIVITTDLPHGFVTNDQVFISGVLGNTNANGQYTIKVTTPTKFELNGSNGTSNYIASTTDKAYGITRIYNTMYNALPLPAGHSQRIPAGAGIKGRILIQIVNGTTVRDVTTEILSMGMTEGEPNAIVQLQRPLWAAFTQGSRDAGNNSNGGTNSPYNGDKAYQDCLIGSSGIFSNTHIGAIGEINGASASLNGSFSYLTELLAPGSGQPVRADSTGFAALMNSDWNTPLWSAAKQWNAIVPINTYNVREGLINSNLPQNAVYERGITSIVEINMRNLARWMEGVYDKNLLAGTGAVSTNIASPDGFTVYVSDRRGDDVRTMIDSSGASIESSNGMVDNADFYGWNDVLNPGEDVQETGSLVKILPLEIPDPDISPAWDSISPTPSFGTDRTKRAIEVAAWSNPTNYFRRAVRLFNGEDLRISSTGRLSATNGITISAENMVYVWGNYNTTGITGQPNSSGTPTGSTLNEAGTNRYLGNQVPASIVADAFFVLSKTWFDAGTSLYPDDVLKRQADQGNTVVGQETSVRAGIIAGNNLAALAGTPDAGQGTATGITDSRGNGGVNNFPRLLESWYDSSGNPVRLNFVGSLIPLFRSTQALGPFNTSVIFKAPVRNWAFDSTFNDPSKLPPGTPMFQYISPTAFRQVL